MFEGEFFDLEFAAAVVNVSHLVATRAMNDGDLLMARRVAEIALSASPYDEISRLDLAKVAELEGNHAEAAQIRGEGILASIHRGLTVTGRRGNARMPL